MGVFLGPGADDHSWRGPVAKCRSRTRSFSKVAAAHGATITMYNTRAMPGLMYAAMFSLPPVAVSRADNAHTNALWHVAPNTITGKGMQQLSQCGGVAMQSAGISCLSALIRAATKTLSWRKPLADLRKAANDDRDAFLCFDSNGIYHGRIFGDHRPFRGQ